MKINMIMTSENNIYADITKTIEEPYKEKEKKPRLSKLKDPNLRDIIVFDLPRRDGLYHGTTFSLRCNNQCHVRGDVVVHRGDEEDIIEKIKKSYCNITSIHQHPESIMAMIPGKEQTKKESHIHFECIRKSHDDTLKLAKFLREL